MGTKRLVPEAAECESQESLAAILASGADLQRRRIYLCGEIDELAAYRFIVALHILDESDGPITVIMNTAGGMCSEGFAIYDAIRFSRNQMVIVGFGQVSSMGTIILQAANARFLSEECDFMIHDATAVDAGSMSLKEVNTLNHDLQRLQMRANKVLVAGSGQSFEQIQKWCQQETTFNATQAVKAGFADEVLRIKTKPRKRKGAKK